MKTIRKKAKDSKKDIARERVSELFRMAGEEFNKNPERSHRYVELARKISMRHNVRIPKALKVNFCKYCYRYLKPGINSRKRVNPRQEAIITHCLECGRVSRIPYRKEKRGV